MNFIQRLDEWSKQHHSGWMDAMRILLGLTLHFKGFLFMWHTADLVRLLNVSFGWNDAVFVAQIIAFMHLFFGTFIMIGLGTRFSCAVMIPVVIGAVFFVNRVSDYTTSSELILSIVVLFMLIFFFVQGSGKFSMQYYISKSRRSRLRITPEPKKA